MHLDTQAVQGTFADATCRHSDIGHDMAQGASGYLRIKDFRGTVVHPQATFHVEIDRRMDGVQQRP